jgi:hypothetical protein
MAVGGVVDGRDGVVEEPGERREPPVGRGPVLVGQQGEQLGEGAVPQGLSGPQAEELAQLLDERARIRSRQVCVVDHRSSPWCAVGTRDGTKRP